MEKGDFKKLLDENKEAKKKFAEKMKQMLTKEQKQQIVEKTKDKYKNHQMYNKIIENVKKELGLK